MKTNHKSEFGGIGFQTVASNELRCKDSTIIQGWHSEIASRAMSPQPQQSGSILPSSAVCVELAICLCDGVGFPRVLQFPPHPKDTEVVNLIGYFISLAEKRQISN